LIARTQRTDWAEIGHRLLLPHPANRNGRGEDDRRYRQEFEFAVVFSIAEPIIRDPANETANL
jgi:hypothetical protein